MIVDVNKKNKIKKAPFQDDYQSVCGIDALYFFIKVDRQYYNDFFINFLCRKKLESEDFEILSKDYNNQFTYFKHFGNVPNKSDEGFARLEICRIGFKNLNEKDNLPQLEIQMNSTTLQQMSIKMIIEYFTELFSGFSLVPQKFQLSRVDVNTYIFDYSFDWLKYDFFSTKIRKSESKYNGTRLETFYLGSRANGLFLRIYDKIKQLTTLEYNEANSKEYLIGKKYISKYHKVPDYKSIWNVELELRRTQLRLYKIDTLQDLEEKVNTVFKMIFTKTMRLLQESKKMDTHDNRILTHSVWSHIINEYDYNGFPIVELDKEKQKEYKRDRIWLRNRLIEFLEEPKNTDFYLREKTEEFVKYLDQYTDIRKLFKEC